MPWFSCDCGFAGATEAQLDAHQDRLNHHVSTFKAASLESPDSGFQSLTDPDDQTSPDHHHHHHEGDHQNSDDGQSDSVGISNITAYHIKDSYQPQVEDISSKQTMATKGKTTNRTTDKTNKTTSKTINTRAIKTEKRRVVEVDSNESAIVKEDQSSSDTDTANDSSVSFGFNVSQAMDDNESGEKDHDEVGDDDEAVDDDEAAFSTSKILKKEYLSESPDEASKEVPKKRRKRRSHRSSSRRGHKVVMTDRREIKEGKEETRKPGRPPLPQPLSLMDFDQEEPVSNWLPLLAEGYDESPCGQPAIASAPLSIEVALRILHQGGDGRFGRVASDIPLTAACRDPAKPMPSSFLVRMPVAAMRFQEIVDDGYSMHAEGSNWMAVGERKRFVLPELPGLMRGEYALAGTRLRKTLWLQPGENSWALVEYHWADSPVQQAKKPARRGARWPFSLRRKLSELNEAGCPLSLIFSMLREAIPPITLDV